MATEIDRLIINSLVESEIRFATSVPCKQLAGIIELLDSEPAIQHVPSNKEDEGMGLCAGAFLGGVQPCILMQNTALGVVVNTLASLIQFYRMPLPMLISYRGEVGEPVACQVEMAVHTKAILEQLTIQTYLFSHKRQADSLGEIVRHAQMSSKPVAILMDAWFWSSAQ